MEGECDASVGLSCQGNNGSISDKLCMLVLEKKPFNIENE